MEHDFPGNIRELENIIEHAFVLCSEGNIKMEHLPGNFFVQPEPEVIGDKGFGDSVRIAEAKIILEALKKNNYNRKATSEFLGMHKSTLFRKINKFGLKIPGKDGRAR